MLYREFGEDRGDGGEIGKLPAGGETFNFQRSTSNAQRSTLNAQRSTLNAQRSTLNAQRSTLNVQRSTLNAQRSTLNAQRSTFNAQRSTSNAQRSTLNAQRSTLNVEWMGGPGGTTLCRPTFSRHGDPVEPFSAGRRTGLRVYIEPVVHPAHDRSGSGKIRTDRLPLRLEWIVLPLDAVENSKL